MSILKLLSAFIVSLPELVKLVQAIADAQKEAATAAKVKEDLGKVHDAFAKKDADALRAIFNS